MKGPRPSGMRPGPFCVRVVLELADQVVKLAGLRAGYPGGERAAVELERGAVPVLLGVTNLDVRGAPHLDAVVRVGTPPGLDPRGRVRDFCRHFRNSLIGMDFRRITPNSRAY